MFRWLIFLVVGYLAYLIWHRRQSPDGDRAPRGKNRPAAERMVACARCGIHLPESESLQDGELRHFCSEAHRRLGVDPDR